MQANQDLVTTTSSLRSGVAFVLPPARCPSDAITRVASIEPCTAFSRRPSQLSFVSLVPDAIPEKKLLSPETSFRHDLIKVTREKSRVLNDSPRFCILTTVLTVYALFGDDVRLAATHQSTDILFNVATIFSIVIFSLEMISSSLAKEGYFLGFFFLLDLGATVTLILDLTWVWDALACNSLNEGGSGALKSSRAGRAGARAARSVRIIRLIRLVKVYKTYKAAAEAKDRNNFNSETKASPGLEDQEDDILNESDRGHFGDNEKKPHSKDQDPETRVGKKFSDMTTRRVIILVLVMLFIMPLFTTSAYGFDEFRVSAHMGAELIYDQLRAWCLNDPNSLPWCLKSLLSPSEGTAADADVEEDRRLSRWWYEKYLLSYIYSHFDGVSAWKLYWVGVHSVFLTSRGADHNLPALAGLNQENYLGSHAVPSDALGAWDNQFTDDSWKTEVLKLPRSVREKLVRPWKEKCSGYFGVGVSPDETGDETECSIDDELRCAEAQSYFPSTTSQAEMDNLGMMFVFDTRETTQLAAGLSILQTFFICFAVGLGAMTFSNDANQLLLKPIERMIAKMERIRDEPLYAMKLGDIEFRHEEIARVKREEKFARRGKCWKFLYLLYDKQRVKEPMETVILERTIIKLGGLLALGFGEAGAEIIGHNMRTGHSSGVNAMIPGQKVDAILGFCTIRNFTEATEVLKENVMIFVNQIGEIVHGCVDDYMGAPNKNIGDCFLLVWRLSGASSEKQSKLADMAIMSQVKIVAEIQKSRILARYREHPGLLQRVKKYRVQLGCGLHCGWAIEGAIGSEFKIDASYLSPNVNVASRLEAATSQFDVSILISHFMIGLCNEGMRGVCRLIDHVTVKGSKQPIRLFTIDLDVLRLPIRPAPVGVRNVSRFKKRQLRELYKTEKWSEGYHIYDAIVHDPDVSKMRARYSTQFFLRFSMAYRNYEAGQWYVARDMLLTCFYDAGDDFAPSSSTSAVPEWPEDGPTKTLLEYMSLSSYIAPTSWPGFRDLTRK